MLFMIKKWVGTLLMPFPFLLFIFAFALILLFLTKKQSLAKILLSITFISLTLLSCMPISDSLIKPFERSFEPLLKADQDLDLILVLGSGGIADPSLPITGQLSTTALTRFMEALRLYHANPKAILVVSGAAFGDVKSHAQLLEELAISMGIPANKIIRLDNTYDTDDEALAMSKIIKNKKAALVTSASHMPRAMKLFAKYNVTPIAAPANYFARERTGETATYFYVPTSYNLYKTKLAWHEYLGTLQYKFKKLFD